MSKWVKLLIGGGITSLLAWGSHAATAERFVGNLHENSSAALKGVGLEGIEMIPAGTEGYLSRIISLSGEGVDAETRAKAEAAIAAGVPNASRVVWTGGALDAAADGASGDGAGAASEAKVAQCQSGVDAAIAGKQINFKSGSAYMPDASLAVVDEVADALKSCSGMNVAIGGHTDATGSAAVNQRLSQGRADAVAAALGERGVDASRITAKGYGSSKPKAEGTGAEANEANRRIEFNVSSAPASDNGAGE